MFFQKSIILRPEWKFEFFVCENFYAQKNDNS